jgi:hypothetical protein
MRREFRNRPVTATIGGQTCHFRSEFERDWALHLERCKVMGAIEKWEYEPETFWFKGIRRGTVSYKPDFRVTEDGKAHYQEVKGYLEQKDITKFRRLARDYPDTKLVLIMQQLSGRRNTLMIEKARPFVARIVHGPSIIRSMSI